MNRLADETSPYLLQHADNPVEWHPWGEEALALAREEDKPILLSVGYAACHWCHVMAHESFEDADALAPMYADPEVMRYVGDGRTLTRADTELSVRRMIERWNEDGFGLYTTLRKDDDAVIGRVGILIWNSETWEPTTRAQASGPTEVEVGYTLGRDFWGQGYATEAAGAVRDFALNGLGADRVIALIIHGNTASENVARKLGLEYERDIKLGRRDAQLFALDT